MTSAPKTPSVTLVAAPPDSIDTDVLVQMVFEGEAMADDHPLAAATNGELGRAFARREFTGKLFERFVTPVVAPGWKAGRVMLAGLGKRADCTPLRAGQLATAAALEARQRHHGRGAVLWAGPAAPAGSLQAVVEGLVLAEFDAAAYKTANDRPAGLRELLIVLDPAATGQSRAEAERSVERGLIVGTSCNVARALANEPGNVLTPTAFAERARVAATAAGLDVDVLDEQRIAELGMGLLQAVARGSVEPPRVIVLRHTPAAAAADGPILGLVGKGVTFDTGGISLKPADGMERMKDDMAGGAAVLGAMVAIARLQVPVHVIGVIPTTENMPGSRALKPGDIVRSAEGKTVEVINTDAEGRLVLGDGLWYARRLGATHLVDVATLTGACVVALGKSTSGLFGAPDGWVDVVRGAADRGGDRVWPLPIFDDYREQLKSDIADISNSGGRPAGAITAALFLKEFAGGLPWAHLDIAGTAWLEEVKPYLPRGATGVAVRTLAALAETTETWPR